LNESEFAMPKTLEQDFYTFEDFCLLVKDGQKADLIEGVIYMASPDGIESNRLSKWLLGVTDDYAMEKDLGECFMLRVAFRLDNKNAPEPDIGLVSKSRLHLVKKGHIAGPPDASFEIVSPESIERDYVKKRNQYEKFGVQEYWIIDPMQESLTVLRLNRRGKYQQVSAKDGIYYSEVIEGFWLDPNWLWQSPRPRKADVLKQLLATKE
jgi:Uma2 family endonuclease